MTPGTERNRPGAITALSVFFWIGAGISFASAISLLIPGSPLEPMWRLNPRAHEAFAGIGAWAVVLMGAVCIACTLAAVGLWRGAVWGYRLAMGILSVNLLGDALNVILGTEPRAAFGLPIAASLIAFLLLSRRVKDFFGARAGNIDAR